VAQAGKRLSPTDPDRTRSRGPSLAWWDMLRLVWRGRLALAARRAEFTLGATPLPAVGEAAERLHVAADLVRVRFGGNPEPKPNNSDDPKVNPNGRLAVAALGVAATAYRSAGLEEAPGALLALPLAEFPAGLALIDPAWHLASGRAADAHHLYPSKPDPCAQQPPVDPVREFGCTGLDVKLRVHAGGAAAVAPAVAEAGLGGDWGGPGLGLGFEGGDPWAAAAAAEAGAAGDGGAARFVGCLGDHQVAFMKALIALAQAPPPHLRMVGKRGTFFAPLDPRRAASPSLPKLLRQCAPTSAEPGSMPDQGPAPVKI